jgi:Cu/Ag efflux protein CusF
MSVRATLAAAALIAASLAPAFADNVTATVTGFDEAGRTITLQDQSQFMSIPGTVAIPEGLKAGDQVSVEFEGSENGVESIQSIQRVR